MAHRNVNLLLVFAGTAAALLVLEVGLRLSSPAELAVNDPYQFTRLIGARRYRIPFHSYREIYPLQFDHDGYYERSDGAIDYDFDQTGGRWIEPKARPLDGDVAIVVGDSFTLGFGLRYQDAYVYKVEEALRQHGRRRHFLNFAQPAANSNVSRRNYLAVRDREPHDLLLYGLHLNDLIDFPTSLVAMADAQRRAPVVGSFLLGFVVRRLEGYRDRNARIAELIDPAQIQQPLFRNNVAAIEAMHRAATERGRGFLVIILPILVDLRAGTFAPVYSAIRQALEQRGIRYLDLSAILADNSDSSTWILPFDQHPNERANEIFAHHVTTALLTRDGAP